MPTPNDIDWHKALGDEDLIDVFLDVIEERIDEACEEREIDSLGSLPDACRALAVMSRVWGEVTNGGFPQFFFNKPDARWHAMAVEAARLMEMPETGKGLRAGCVIVRDLLPALEGGGLDWTAYSELVWEEFNSRCGSEYLGELNEFRRRGAVYIRSNPDFGEFSPLARRKYAEREEARRERKLPVSTREREVVFSADTLKAYLDDFTPDAQRESLSATQSAKGAISIDYAYGGAGCGISIRCEVVIHPDVQDAEYWCEASSKSLWSAFGWNLNPKRQVEEQNDFFRWGEQSYYCSVIFDGAPFGLGFCARSGRKRLSLTLLGVCFLDPALFAEALGPALANMTEYEP